MNPGEGDNCTLMKYIIFCPRYKASPPSFAKLWAMRAFNVVFFFTIPAITINVREEARGKLEKELERGKLEVLQSGKSNVRKAHLERIREINCCLQEASNSILVFKRSELSIGILPQIVVQLMMVMLSPKFTVSATHSGLQALFETEDSTLQFWLGINSIALIFGSIGWSLKTTASSYVDLKTDRKIDFYPIMPRILLGLRTLLIVITEICCIVCYFAPFLGILGCLAHWRADQLLLGESEQADYTDYTVISLGAALLVFVGGMFLKALIIFVLKTYISKDFSCSDWSARLKHIVEVLNIPGKIESMENPRFDSFL